MAYSYVIYGGNGSTTDYAVPFPYLLQDHVTVTVNGTPATFSWLNAQTVRLVATPALGAEVKVLRSSGRSHRLTDFQDAASLTEATLDFDANQLFYLTQEAFDAASVSSIGGGDMLRANNLADVYSASAALGNLNAFSRAGGAVTGPITLPGPPASGLHAATKAYVDDAVAAGVGSGAAVSSVNGRSGAVTISSADVTGALTFTPVNKAGDTMTGSLALPGAPTDPLHAATKAYVDSVVVSGGVNVAANYAWTGSHTWGGTLGFDENYRALTLIRDDALPLHPSTGEHNCFAGFLTKRAGGAADSLVPFVSHGISDGLHGGNVWGMATEAYNASSKAGGFASQLFGAEVSIINMVPTSTAPRHAGLLVVFKNRLDAQSVPVNAPPTGSLPSGQAFNKNTSAIYIDTGAGRIGSSSNPYAGNKNIQCGWNKGIYFSPYSLDSAGTTKAVGIDFTALANIAPEGGQFSDRLISGVALPDYLPLTLSTDMTKAKIHFDGTDEIVTFSNNTQFRFGIRMNSGWAGRIIQHEEGLDAWGSRWIDTASSWGNAIMSVNSAGRTAGPGNPGAIANWLGVYIDGVRYCLPVYL